MPGIEAAYRGRMNMLGSIFGGTSTKPKAIDNGPSLFKDLKRMALKRREKHG